MLDNKVKEFLKDLKALCDKHSIRDFGGCGCMGSPYATLGDETIENITYNDSELSAEVYDEVSDPDLSIKHSYIKRKINVE